MTKRPHHTGIDRRAFLGAAGAGVLSLLAGRAGLRLPTAVAQQQVGDDVPATPPNIVIILADDLGYGDIACYDPEHCKIPTPHVDALAEQGMRFTDAHTTSPVCSPSRYGLMTGRYHWRAGIRAALPKWAQPCIAEDRLTIGKMLQQQGYHTACIGKWHLGWDWPRTDGELDFTKPIANGPTTRGFDYYFGVDVPNFPPFTWIENDRVTVQPTEHQEIDEEIIVNHEGPKAPGWRFDRIVPTIVDKSVAYIEERAASGKPFFLFVSLTSPHYPIAPSEPFKGKSGINPLADFIMETDATVGAISDALERAGVSENTLLLFLSDNGHDPKPGLESFQQAGHRVSGPLRGTKFNIAEGGHRVPFVIRWPKVVQPGSICHETISATDLMATAAQITGATLPDNAAEDSFSFLPLLRGETQGFDRPPIVAHSPTPAYSIQSGPWKLLFLPSQRGEPERVHLYNLEEDLYENHNIASEHSERVEQMRALMRQYVENGRSVPGTPQANDVEVKVPALG